MWKGHTLKVHDAARLLSRSSYAQYRGWETTWITIYVALSSLV